MNVKEVLAEVVKSRPVDKTARRVMQKGVHYDAPISPAEIRSAVPLPLKPVPPDAPDFTGKTVGRFLVIGMADLPHRKNGAAWVVRCSCGYYRHCKTRILRKNDPQSMCSSCYRTEKMKRERTA